MHSQLNGKRIALFGASGGIGSALCRYILSLGGTLITIDRNPKKSAALVQALRTEFPQGQITPLLADLEDLSQVKRLCGELITLDVDMLIHNAGAYSIPRRKCATGLDNVFQINFFSPYYITRQLLPYLENKGGRIVAVGSIAHTYSKTDPEDVDFSTRKQANLAYGNAKRYLMYALHSLMAEHPGVHFTLTHPGITFTNITAHYPKWLFAIIKHPMKVIFMPAKKAALCILEGLFRDTPPYRWIGPSVFHVWGKPRCSALRSAAQEEICRIDRTARELYDKIKI